MLHNSNTIRRISLHSLFTGLATAATLLVGLAIPSTAQQPSDVIDTLPSGEEAIEDLQIDGQNPSISLPSAPDASDLQQEDEMQEEQEDEALPQDRETWQQQEDTLQQQEEEQQPVIGVDDSEDAPPASETPEQDSPDTLEIPF
ncbi:MAG TPA: hypothetical protein V6C65_35220 [Allocoleopsis sp.]